MRIPRTLLQPARQALLAAIVSIAAAVAASAAPMPGPPHAARVLVISVDGLRPDVLLRARAPALRGLMARGSFTMWARTIPAAITLPSHTSMLTGVSEERHGIDWNGDRPREQLHYANVPTLFDLAHAAGLSTAMVTGKSKFVALARPGSLDHVCVPDSGRAYSDSAVADTAVRWIRQSRPRVLFVHLPGCDLAGHEFGWGSDRQLKAVAVADRCIARVLEACRAGHLLDSTIVIVSADHGGAHRTHGADDPRSRTIPWIVAGPGVRANLDLSSIDWPDVRTEDTFATACWVLGLQLPDGLDGQPVRAAFTP